MSDFPQLSSFYTESIEYTKNNTHNLLEKLTSLLSDLKNGRYIHKHNISNKKIFPIENLQYGLSSLDNSYIFDDYCKHYNKYYNNTTQIYHIVLNNYYPKLYELIQSNELFGIHKCIIYFYSRFLVDFCQFNNHYRPNFLMYDSVSHKKMQIEYKLFCGNISVTMQLYFDKIILELFYIYLLDVYNTIMICLIDYENHENHDDITTLEEMEQQKKIDS